MENLMNWVCGVFGYADCANMSVFESIIAFAAVLLAVVLLLSVVVAMIDQA